MMKKMALVALGVAMTMGLTGCVPPVGQDFNRECEKNFMPGKTTLKEAEACLGPHLGILEQDVDGERLYLYKWGYVDGLTLKTRKLQLYFTTDDVYKKFHVFEQNDFQGRMRD